jgi:hypothetical protein
MSEENWQDALPEPLRDAPFIGKAENLDDAIGKLAHAAQYMGQAVKLPPQDASTDDLDAFYDKVKDVPGMAKLPALDDIEGTAALLAKLGAPAEHTDYKLPELDEYSWDENKGEALRQYAQKAGLTKAQFNQFALLMAEQDRQAGSEATTALEAMRKELRLDWGDTLEEREGLIRGWMDKSDAPESMRELLDNRELPLESMNWLYSVAKQFKGEVAPVARDGKGSTPDFTVEEARSKIQEILNHPAYFDAAHPQHQDMVKMMIKLQGLANPEAAA